MLAGRAQSYVQWYTRTLVTYVDRVYTSRSTNNIFKYSSIISITTSFISQKYLDRRAKTDQTMLIRVIFSILTSYDSMINLVMTRNTAKIQTAIAFSYHLQAKSLEKTQLVQIFGQEYSPTPFAMKYWVCSYSSPCWDNWCFLRKQPQIHFSPFLRGKRFLSSWFSDGAIGLFSSDLKEAPVGLCSKSMPW